MAPFQGSTSVRLEQPAINSLRISLLRQYSSHPTRRVPTMLACVALVWRIAPLASAVFSGVGLRQRGFPGPRQAAMVCRLDP